MRSYPQPLCLTRHADDQFRDLTPDGRSSRIEAALRAVELLRDQLAKPGQDCFWLGDRGHRFESSIALNDKSFSTADSQPWNFRVNTTVWPLLLIAHNDTALASLRRAPRHA